MNFAEKIREKLTWRYAVKRFDPIQKISPSDWNLLEDSLILSPSSYGLQPWKFLVIQSPDLRKKLREVSWNQKQVEDASHYLVFTTRTEINEKDVDRYLIQMAHVRNIPISSLETLKKSIISDVVTGPRSTQIGFWAQRQSYIAMGFLLETAALMGIDTCPIEGLDPRAYDEILNLKKAGYNTVAAVALGYRHSEDSFQHNKKVRFDKKEVIQYL